jgi:hypothetical protein
MSGFIPTYESEIAVSFPGEEVLDDIQGDNELKRITGGNF